MTGYGIFRDHFVVQLSMFDCFLKTAYSAYQIFRPLSTSFLIYFRFIFLFACNVFLRSSDPLFDLLYIPVIIKSYRCSTIYNAYDTFRRRIFMYINEYGDSSLPKILCLHPLGITGEDLYNAVIPYLRGNYCIISPDQGGHGKSGHYISFENEVGTLKEYLSQKGYNEFLLLYGASMGVTTAYELLKDPDLHFEKIWFDGAGFTEEAPRGMGIIKPAFRIGLRFLKKFPGPLERSFKNNYGPWFSKIMIRNFMNIGTEDVIKVFETFSCRQMKEIPADTQSRIHLDWGSEDANYKNSMQAIQKYFPHAATVIRTGYGHCGYMAFNTEKYVQELEQFMTDQQNS